ncbi:MAG: HD domain-containing protein, partial [Chloroflexi bacterium]|nr:HD domain-containing protein [Chloroflexota bacterium]
LNLNEDLAEAIALCHDLGHPPFGHAGERALDSLLPGGFRHHEQTLRIVDHLEKGGAGLNLTWEVRDALTKHSKPRSSIAASETGFALTLEGQVVKLADGIAYLNHDLGDAIRAGLFAERDLPEVVFAVLGDRESTRVDTMVCDVIESSWDAVRAGESSCGQTEAELHRLLAELAERAEAGESLVTMSPPVLGATDALREFMFERVYLSPDAQAEDRRVERVVVALYAHFCARPAELPVELREDIAGGESLARAVGDYLAGMTDRFALRVFDGIARVGA